jgi:hypothetical protein
LALPVGVVVTVEYRSGSCEAGGQGVLPDEVQGRGVHQFKGEFVFTAQSRVAHGWVVGAECDADARRDQGRELVLRAAPRSTSLDVAGDGDL